MLKKIENHFFNIYIYINKENSKYKYNPLVNPYYSLNQNSFTYEKRLNKLKKYDESYKSRKMLIITKELLKSADTKK